MKIEEPEYIFEIPTGEDLTILELLFGFPIQYTDGHYINILLIAIFGVLFIGSHQQQQIPDIQKSSVFAATGTFIAAFSLTILSTFTETPIAGQNQLIPATVILVSTILWIYMTDDQTGGVQ